MRVSKNIITSVSLLIKSKLTTGNVLEYKVYTINKEYFKQFYILS